MVTREQKKVKSERKMIEECESELDLRTFLARVCARARLLLITSMGSFFSVSPLDVRSALLLFILSSLELLAIRLELLELLISLPDIDDVERGVVVGVGGARGGTPPSSELIAGLPLSPPTLGCCQPMDLATFVLNQL